jgi:FkbM family methyltransferase
MRHEAEDEESKRPRDEEKGGEQRSAIRSQRTEKNLVSALFFKQRAAVMACLGPLIGKPRGWERIMRCLVPFDACAGLAPKEIVREGFKVVSNPSVPIGYHLRFFGSYERQLRAVMRRVLRPGSVALDVGANVGWHTLLMSRLVGSEGCVVAVEANPSVRRMLDMHLSMNGAGNVRVVPFALAAKAQTLDFVGPDFDNPGAGDGHVASEEERSSGQTIKVQARTADEVAEEQELKRLDFVKIDVEGFEWPVLQGARECLARFRPAVVFEFDANYVGRGGGSPADLRAYFSDLDYDLASIGRSRLSETNWPNCGNMLATPREKVTA